MITFHLKIVNEGTSVAFDDIICTHSLKHKTIQPNKYNVTLSRSFKVAAESFANWNEMRVISSYVCISSRVIWPKWTGLFMLHVSMTLMFRVKASANICLALSQLFKLRKLVWRLLSKARMQFIKAFFFQWFVRSTWIFKLL